MKLTREPITFDELKEGEHVIRHETTSRSNPDGTYSIFFRDKLIAVLFFDGTVRIFTAGMEKNAVTKKRYNMVLLPLGKFIIESDKLWWLCNKGKYREEEVEPKLFNENMVVSP